MKTYFLIALIAISIQINPQKTFSQINSGNENSKNQILQSRVQNSISKEEYNISFDDNLNSYQSPNRKNNIRFIYNNDGFTAQVRQTRIPLFDESDISINENEKKYKILPDWQVKLQVEGFSKSGGIEKNGDSYFSGKEFIVDGNKASIENNKFKISYENSEAGMRQDFIIKEKPDGNENLNLAIKINSELSMKVTKDKISFIHSYGDVMMSYSNLKVYDATGKILNAYFSKSKIKKNEFQICVNDENAQYPITIDPLSTTPCWTSEGNQSGANFGMVVNSAGDVNDDGYDDIIVSAPLYDNGQADEGKVFIYYGSSSGLSGTPDWTAESNKAGAQFGISASSGDVNGDGFVDLLVGAYLYNNGETNEGMAFLWYGSVTGFGAFGTPLNADWKAEGNQTGAGLGSFVKIVPKKVSDLNTFVMISSQYFSNGQAVEGAAFIWNYSSGLGPDGNPSNADWMYESNQNDARTANSVYGDFNGDGYTDIGFDAYRYDNPQHDEGKIFLYYGSATGFGPNGSPSNADWSYESNQADALVGEFTSLDVNSDGYTDLITGASYYDAGQTDEGKVFAFYGSATGLSLSPNWTAEGNQAGAIFFRLGNAGDVNCDGFQDLIVGARQYDNPGAVDGGKAFIYYGSASGLSANPDWTAESDQTGAQFGYSVANAGDVYNTGCNCVIIGAPYFDNGQTDEGKVFVYCGSTSSSPVGLNGNFIYNSITEAYNAISNPVTSPQLIEIKSSYTGSGETFPITLTDKGATDSTKTITIRPKLGDSAVIQKNMNGPVFYLDGAKHIVIDGRAGGVDTLRKLTINNNNTDTTVSSVKARNGCSFITLQYTNFNVSGGTNLDFFQGDTTNITDSLGKIHIRKNYMNGGNTGCGMDNSKPIIIDRNYTFNCLVAGIYLRGTKVRDCYNNYNQIFGNEITMKTPENNNIYTYTNIYGILLYKTTAQIYGNKIYGLSSIRVDNISIMGIEINSTCAYIYNNFISLCEDNESSYYVVGISSIQSNSYIFHNSIRIKGTSTNQNPHIDNIGSAGLAINLPSGYGICDIKNNIVLNERNGGNASAIHTGIYLTGTGISSILTDGNMFYSLQGNHANFQGINKDIADYKLMYPTDEKSIFYKANFQGINNLHLNYNLVNGNYWCFSYNNPWLGPITNDIDLDIPDIDYPDFARGNYPFRGADEGPNYFKLENIGVDFEGPRGGYTYFKDSVEVLLANSVYPHNIIQRNKAVIDSGTNRIKLAFLSGAVNNVPYYIIVKTKNTLETWSSTAVSFTGNSLTYDFTTSASQAFGNNLKLVNGKWCIYSGDINQDGLIDLSDVIGVFNDASVFLTGNVVSDLNGDNIVDLSDLTTVYNNSASFIATISPLNP